ncbi:HAD family hydrolase [Haloarchaeobius sp. HRN-SO-5]|uniref:HAD family hydrolase n=1 Tax=Haloarchaeobius sp. HRN-SO-5 TaxID=3446118 RepID=UPI003EC015C8
MKLNVLLTNGLTSLQREKLDAVGLLEYFDAVVVSQAVDAWKPDREIYEIAESRLPGEAYTFVADDYERDLAPAVELGWDAVLVGDDHPAVTCVETLSDLDPGV